MTLTSEGPITAIVYGYITRFDVDLPVAELVHLKQYLKLDIHWGGSRFPNRGGGLTIQTISDKICLDNKSLQGGLGI